MTADGLAEARARDAADPLRAYRDRFQLPAGVTYLDGNSLGALPRMTASRVAEVVRAEWGDGLIGSWNHAGWIDAPTRVGARIAPLIGAHAHEVIVADSTSVNLHKLLAAAVADQPGRRVILTEASGFPTDLYVATGLAAMTPGLEVRAVAREAIAGALDSTVSVLLATHVHYKTGEAFDMAALTAQAHAVGALTLWDLSHSAGAVVVDLEGAGADLAVGCGYKYLNGGPGAPAYLYVAERHQGRLHSPMTGWMGHAAPFDFTDDWSAAPGMAGFLCGTPPILGLAALEAGVGVFADVEMAALASKSQALCDAFIAAVEALCNGAGLELATPRDRTRRGAHVSFRHPHAHPVMQALIARGVIGDFRAPDILRFGFPALYTRFEDAWRAADALREVLVTGVWREPAYQRRAAVT